MKSYRPPFTAEEINLQKNVGEEIFFPTDYGQNEVLNQIYELENGNVFLWSDVGQIPAGYSFLLYGFTIGATNTSGLVVQYNLKLAICDASDNVIRNFWKMMLPKVGGASYQECFSLEKPYLLHSLEKIRFNSDSSIAVNLLCFGILRKN